MAGRSTPAIALLPGADTSPAAYHRWGRRSALAVVLDASAREDETVYRGGGRRGLDVEPSPSDLAELTGARIAPITAGAAKNC